MEKTRFIKEFCRYLSVFSFENPLKSTFFLFFAFFSLWSFLPDLKSNTSSEAFLKQEDPSAQVLSSFQETFGRDEAVILGIESDNIFSVSFFEKLHRLEKELEHQVPHLDEIHSLISAAVMGHQGSEIQIRSLSDDWPPTASYLSYLKSTVLEQPLLQGLVSDDLQVTALVIRPDFSKEIAIEDIADLYSAEESPSPPEGRQSQEFVNAIEAVANSYQGDNFQIHFSGLPVLNNSLQHVLEREVPLSLGLSVVLIAMWLYWVFRRILAVLLPLTVVAMVLPTVFSLMAWMERPVTIVTQILPFVILAVGVCNSVHFLSHFFQHFCDSQDKRSSLLHAVDHSIPAMLLSNLTTAIGLLSFSIVGMPPIADLGLFSAIGVLLLFITNLVLMSSSISLFSVRASSRQSSIDEVVSGVLSLS